MSTPTPVPTPTIWHVIGAALLHDARADLIPPLTTFLGQVQAAKTDPTAPNIAGMNIKQAGYFTQMVGAWALAAPKFVADSEADIAGALASKLTAA